MTLPVLPDVGTILANSVSTLRDEVLPEVRDEWPRSCVRLVIASLDYAAELLRDDRGTANTREIAAELDALTGELPEAAAVAAGETGSPFVVAGRLLVWAQENPGAAAERVRSALHPVLVGQLEREAATAMPLLVALAQTMFGEG